MVSILNLTVRGYMKNDSRHCPFSFFWFVGNLKVVLAICISMTKSTCKNGGGRATVIA